MRIITGKYKGRTIKMPKGIRPTQNKVRKALFDILGDMKGLSFLELFAGSGAVGLEALSYGAKEVVFVEKDKRCVEKIKENLSVIPSSRHPVIPSDVFLAIKHLHKEDRKFNIIFLDPPYYKGMVPRLRSGLAATSDSDSLAKKTLQMLASYDILAHTGLIIAQHHKKDTLPERLGILILFRQASYGDAVLSFYKRDIE